MTTKKEIKAGWELDALVAERLMGYHIKTLAEWGDQWYPCNEYRALICCGRWYVPDPEDPAAFIITDDHSLPGAEEHPSQPPLYSTEIHAAWQLVGKMHSRGWIMRLDMVKGVYKVNFIRPGDRLPTSIVDGHDAPEAICIAALLAVEGEKK